MIIRSFRFLLQPTTQQARALDLLLWYQRELYNAALQERIGAWKWEERSVSFYDQCRTLTGLREVRPEILDAGVVVCRGTLQRLDRAFTAFYRRCKRGDSPGFPRFQSRQRWDSIQWEDTSGWQVKESDRRLRLLGVGEIKVRMHRQLSGVPKAITVKREGRRWWVTVRCVGVPAQPLFATGREIGIDLGIVSLLTTSDGEHVENPLHAQRSAERLRAAQRELARKRRGSGHRRKAVERVAACHRKVRNQRADHLHKLSRRLVNGFDLIVHEDLKIANMVRRPKSRPNENGGFELNGAAAKSGLNRSIHEAGWGILLRMIAYKAEDAGREVIAVDPRHTSQMCFRCGHIERENRVTQARFECQRCGFVAHADANAARNILRLGQSQRAASAEHQ